MMNRSADRVDASVFFIFLLSVLRCVDAESTCVPRRGVSIGWRGNQRHAKIIATPQLRSSPGRSCGAHLLGDLVYHRCLHLDLITHRERDVPQLVHAFRNDIELRAEAAASPVGYPGVHSVGASKELSAPAHQSPHSSAAAAGDPPVSQYREAPFHLRATRT